MIGSLHRLTDRRGQAVDLTPRLIAGVYVVLGLGLLFVSDVLFPMLVSDPGALRNLQALKGAAEIAVSGGVIYALVDRSQTELRETNALLEGILDASPLSIVVTDRAGDTTVWNQRAEEVYGWSEEEVLGGTPPNVPEERREEFERLRERTVEEGESIVGHETVRRTSEGSLIDVSVTTGSVRDSDGDVVGVMAIQEDVTERREREREFRETRQTLQAVVDASPIGILAVDEDGKTRLWSPGCEQIFGWSEEEVLGEPLPNVQEERRDEIRELREQMYEEAEPVVGYETVRQTRDGSLVDVALTTAPMRDADGEVIGVMGLFEDITERKERERELREERELFERVLETSPIGITVLDAEGNIERANDRAEEIFGLEEAEIADRTYADPEWEIFDENGDLIPPEELPFARVLDSGKSVFGFEHGIETPAGAERWLSVNAAPLTVSDGEVERVVAAIADVTERRERKEALEASEARYRAIAETTPDAILTVDGEGTIRFANSAVESVFGYAPEQLEGEPLTTLVPERFRDRHRAGLTRFVETGERQIDWTAVEFPGLREDGEEVNLSFSFASYEEDGERRITAIARDLTDRERMERELDRNEQRYRNLIENSPAPINIFDANGDIVWGNEAVVELLGLEDEEDLIGRSIFEFVHPDDHDVANVELADVIDADAVVGPTNFRLRRPDGQLRYVQVMTVGGWYAGERVGQAVVVDVTELREKEMALRQNERRYRTLVEMSPDPILVHVDGEIVYANHAMADLVDAAGPDEVVGTSVARYVDPDAHGDVEEVARETQRGEREPTSQPYTVVTLDGDRRHIESTSRPIAYEGEAAVLTIAKDVTDRYEYEQTLRTLHERTRSMARGESREEIARIAVEATDELLDLDGTVMYEFDGGDELVPLAWSDPVDGMLDERPVASKGSGFLWEVFVDGEEQFFRDLQSSDALPHDVPLRSALALPVSNHGVLLTGATSERSLSATEREVAHLIGENLDAALDRAEREDRLRERDRELERQNERLEQLNRLNGIIRETTQALIQSRSRPEVESRVCEQFASATEYAFAWLGTRDEDTGGLRLRQYAEMDPEYADQLSREETRTPLHALVDAAVREGTVQTARNVLDDPEWEDHRRDALNQGYRSVAVVPIVLNEAVDGVLVIHGRAADLFDAREREVLEELGHTIGYALRNVSRVETLQATDRTEVEILIGDERLFSNRIATEIGTGVEFIGAIAGEGETVRAFLRFTGLPDGGIEDELRGFEIVTDVQPLSVEEGTGLYQVTITTPRLLGILQGHDVRLRGLEVEDGETTVTALLSGDAPVRSLVEELQAVYSETELRARREDPDHVDTRETFRDRLVQQLTEKQLDALRTALYGGFYEWPRASTSEELAETRDIASSTFQHHLRAAERKLVSAVLGSA